MEYAMMIFWIVLLVVLIIVEAVTAQLVTIWFAAGAAAALVAELCGLHRTYISDVECFRRSISLENIQKIADALEIETYKLFIE